MFAIRRILLRTVHAIFRNVAPVQYKHWMELKYWRGRQRQESQLANAHYEYFYTTFFGLSRDDYKGRCVLDIGCGPRGSLEWIAADAKCVGVDPLIPQYRSLGIDNHRMTYVHAGVEKIPLPNDEFQIVASFNNLDHVDNVQKAVSEIKRVTSPGGTFLLITEVEHEASPTEPQNLPRSIASWFEPEFEVTSQRICAIRDDHDIYQSLRDNKPFISGKEGIVYARLVKR